MSILRQGVVYERADKLRIGQRVNLQNDMFADTAAYEAFKDGGDADDAADASEHPEFASAYEVVVGFELETPDECIRIDFEGMSVGFPPDHEIEIDPEQDLVALDAENEAQDKLS